MLFYGGTFLHYKKFVNKFLWLCVHVHKIFRSCAHARMIGEHKKACTQKFRTLPHLNRFFLNRDLKIILFN